MFFFPKINNTGNMYWNMSNSRPEIIFVRLIKIVVQSSHFRMTDHMLVNEY